MGVNRVQCYLMAEDKALIHDLLRKEPGLVSASHAIRVGLRLLACAAGLRPAEELAVIKEETRGR